MHTSIIQHSKMDISYRCIYSYVLTSLQALGTLSICREVPITEEVHQGFGEGPQEEKMTGFSSTTRKIVEAWIVECQDLNVCQTHYLRG
jgi:hypothetical protein